MFQDHNEVWRRCLSIMHKSVSKEIFDTWFKPIMPLAYNNNELLIQVPSHFFIEYLEENFLGLLRSSIHQVLGPTTKLLYRVMVEAETKTTLDYEESSKSTINRKETKKTSAAPKAVDPFEQKVYRDLDPQLNENYTFDNYYSGSSNKLARAAGEAIALNPGKTAFNPFFVYGNSGVGKTHLMNAIGTKIKETSPDKRVLYVSTHLFQVQFTDAARSNTINDFINFYQSIDVLLIDDIQELGGKTATQNTFFHIFNHLHQNGKQLIMTSDRPPVSLVGLEDRLLTRFKWGLTAEMERPDYELRKRILVNKIRHDGLSISENVIDYIAKNISNNVRDLEGVIVSLMAHSMVYQREIDIDLAERVLQKSVKIEKRQISPDQIKEVVCAYYQVDIKDFLSSSRKSEVVLARQVSMYLCKKYTDLSYNSIGEVSGKRNHATVIHACRTITNYLENNKELKSQLDEIENMLKS
ncbi:MAG: chromosomal replication initiator protein DnaA [Bacteroidales bacterium]